VYSFVQNVVHISLLPYILSQQQHSSPSLSRDLCVDSKNVYNSFVFSPSVSTYTQHYFLLIQSIPNENCVFARGSKERPFHYLEQPRKRRIDRDRAFHRCRRLRHRFASVLSQYVAKNTGLTGYLEMDWLFLDFHFSFLLKSKLGQGESKNNLKTC